MECAPFYSVWQHSDICSKRMENRNLLIAFLVVWVAYLFVVHIWAWRKQLPVAGVIASHAVPSAVAITMTYIFIMSDGSTIAQFVAGSESGMNLWRLWLGLWGVLSIVTATSVLIHLVWTIIASVKKTQRKWVPVTICAVIMSGFAFITVFGNFPDA